MFMPEPFLPPTTHTEEVDVGGEKNSTAAAESRRRIERTVCLMYPTLSLFMPTLGLAIPEAAPA